MALLTAVLAGVRPSRVVHYLAMVLFGVQLGLLPARHHVEQRRSYYAHGARLPRHCPGLARTGAHQRRR
ncbi:MAG: hypothetical protein U0514_01115 [Candidatus Andersenbacteria bacterium]